MRTATSSGRSAFPATPPTTTRPAPSPASKRPDSSPIPAAAKSNGPSARRGDLARAASGLTAAHAPRYDRLAQDAMDVGDLGLEAFEEQPRLRAQGAPLRLDHHEFGVERW